MRRAWLPAAPLLGVLIIIAACAPGTASRAVPGGSQSSPAPPKRISAVVTADLPSVRSQLSRAAGGALPGAREIEQLVHSGLAVEDERGNLHAQLADAVPSLENGRWMLLPDGRMETSWTILPGAVWHDGTPFTTSDLLFTAQIARDKDFAVFGQLAYDSVEDMVAVDGRTLTVRWKRPYIEADGLFAGVGSFQGTPLPRHLLEQPFLEQRAAFLNLPYWTTDFIGTGPFRLQEWSVGSRAVLLANERYALGRPKIDEIQVRFISDPNTLIASLLAQAVELPIGRGLSFEQTVQVRDQWRAGKVEFVSGGAIKVWPQLMNPTPGVVADLQFRRAVYQAIDRQQLADTLMLGLAPVAHSILVPIDREWDDVESGAVRYGYDPRAAGQTIEGLGYRRGPDGALRDAAGERLQVELRATVIDVLIKATTAVADDWQKIGLATELHSISPARQSDREYRARFPGFDTSRGTNSVESFKTFLSSEARVPANQFAGQNYPGYANPELDALINRYLVTIPTTQRTEAARSVLQHLSDQVVVMPLFYDVVGTMVGDGLTGMATAVGQGRTSTWNAHLWDRR